MASYRQIPADRIKRLVCVEAFASEKSDQDVNDSALRTRLCEQVARAISEKLFEFNKVNIWRDEEKGIYVGEAMIEVIVPAAKPYSRGAKWTNVQARIEELSA